MFQDSSSVLANTGMRRVAPPHGLGYIRSGSVVPAAVFIQSLLALGVGRFQRRQSIGGEAGQRQDLLLLTITGVKGCSVDRALLLREEGLQGMFCAIDEVLFEGFPIHFNVHLSTIMFNGKVAPVY